MAESKYAGKVIAVEDLSKSFGDHQVLRKIDFTVSKGEVICIVGSSGSGKSTLLRCINKLEHQTDGKIYFNGSEVADKQRDINNYRSKVGMVFQSFNLFNNMTVLKNCMVAVTSVLHESKEEARERAIKHLKAVGMAPYINAYPAQLSGGQKQRVAIARALAAKTKYLLCDEATSALDPDTTRAILELMKKINKTMGVTIVVITHEMKVIDSICDRVAVLDKSTVAELGNVKEVFANPQSDIARKLVLPENKLYNASAVDGRKIRIVYNGENSFEPLLAKMILECGTPVNILHADTNDIDGRAFGQMLLQLPAESEEKIINYLEKSGLEFNYV